jgi:Tetratricopeptide repeat
MQSGAATKATWPDGSWIAKAAIHLAVAYAEDGQAAEAETLLKLAIALGEKSLGPDHPFVSAALYNLAVLYARQQRFAGLEQVCTPGE